MVGLERFEIFAEANKVARTNIHTVFLFSLGPQLYRLVREAVAPEKPNSMSLEALIEAVQGRFDPIPGIYTARAEFYARKQQPDESVAVFMTNLRRLARRCQFEATPTVVDRVDAQLQDQFIIGMCDAETRRRILRGPKLPLKEVYSLALLGETVATQSRLLEERAAGSPAPTVHALSNKNRSGRSNQASFAAEGTKCWRCDRKGHSADSCRFKESLCHRCHKKGHVSKVCRSSLPTTGWQQESAISGNSRRTDRRRSVHAVEQTPSRGTYSTSESEDDLSQSRARVNAFKVNAAGSHHVSVEPATTLSVLVNGTRIEFEVDSGSALTLISEKMFHRLWKGHLPKLRSSSLKINTWSKERMAVLGYFRARVQYKRVNRVLEIFVMRNGGRPLLGRAWFGPFKININVPLHQISAAPAKAEALLSGNWLRVTERYPEVFQPGLGKYKGPPIHIDLVPGARARFLKCRHVPFALVDRVKEEIERLDKRGSLEPVLWSDWASPIVTVMKKGGEIRICGDYSATVNLVTRKDVYPIPTGPEMFSILSGGAWFSKLDLSEAYQQLTLDEKSAEILTLNTPKGLRRMKRLPFGVDVAPGIFQRLMETLLQGIPGVKPYLDDILITGRSEREHDCRLDQVLKVLADNGLRLNKEKCSFGAEEMEFLGFRVTKAGVRPTEDKLRAIREASPPKDVKQLQAFLGLLNFYSAFMPKKATVLEPLHRLLDATKPSTWHWEAKEQASFEAAKRLLTTDALLAHFDGTKPLTLACDASDYGLGAVLSQIESGQEKVIAYASRTMSKTERNYGQIDKEALALMFGVKKFHQYLFGRHFTAFTDHKPLLGLLATRKPTPTLMTTRMLRWRLLLSAYDIDLAYRSGKSMGNADGLSRLPLPTDRDHTGTPGEKFVQPSLFADVLMMGIEGSDSVDDVTLLDAREVAKLTRKDPILSRVQHWVLHGWPGGSQGDPFTQFIRRRDELTVIRGCLLWGSRVIVPKRLQKDVLEVLHHAHPGTVRMKALARSYVWWPGIDETIERRVAECSDCQQYRGNPPKAPPRVWNWTPRPWSRIHIDFAGPFRGKTYLLIVDSHSKWLDVEQVASTESKEVIRHLARLFATHGLPDVLVSDNGTAFDSGNFRQFCTANRIRFLRVAPYHPSSNGLVERVVQTTKQALRAMASDKWGITLSRFLFNYRLTPHSATGLSPAEILLRRRPKSLLDNLHPDLLAVKEKTQQEDAINLGTKDSRRMRPFQVGDRVWARDFHPHTATKWLPGVVQEVITPRSFWVELPQTETRVRRSIDHICNRGSGGSPAIPEFERSIPSGTGTYTPVTTEALEEKQSELHEPATEAPDQETPTMPAEQMPAPQRPVAPTYRETDKKNTTPNQRPMRRTQRPRYLNDYVT
ncbi:hypothetical protein M513_07218 [Trichuris suis]|uniref:RNA-directed DNA polymerase n=1 Tax=Trichuris suis TaxID=68888 RepID=A0A085M3U3_9BILA|nr:hypothetical protein M513_07218 [Trichuris suis]